MVARDLSLSSPRKLRESRGESQGEFWARIGVSQASGSRYEGGHPLPKPARLLLQLAYGPNPMRALAKLRGVTVQELTEGCGRP